MFLRKLFATNFVQPAKKKKNGRKKNPYLFQYKLSYINETGTYHHGLMSTSVR